MSSMSCPAIGLFIIIGCLIACGGSSCSASENDGDIDVIFNSNPVTVAPPVAAEPEPEPDHTIESYELSESVSPDGLVHRTLRAITLVEAVPAGSRDEVLETAREIMAMNPDLAGLPEGSGRFLALDVVATDDHDIVVFEREIDTDYGPVLGVGGAHYLFDAAGLIEEIVLYFQLP